MNTSCFAAKTVAAAALAASAWLALASPAAAQTPAYIVAKPAAAASLGSAVAARIFSDEWTPVRQAAVQRSQKAIPGFECPADAPVALVDVIPYRLKPGVPSWIEKFVLGCKPRTMRNLLMILDGERPRTVELLPGQSGADPLLQRDALQGASAAAISRRAKECKVSYVVDTRTTSPQQGGGAWSERWAFDQCGARTEVDVLFAPSDKGGTTWSVKLAP